MNEKILGHLAAFIAVSVWGTTYISTKILLESFNSVEILVIRFVIGTLVLTLAAPKWLRLKDKKQELYYILCGLTGVTLYYLIEIIAISYTFASNVGVIISTAPFFTAIVVHFGSKEKEPFYKTFFIGFVVALIGIILISFDGAEFHVSPLGDILTIVAAFFWALYSFFLRKINTFGYPNLQNTKRIFLWGLLFMVPLSMFMGFSPDLQQIARPVNFLNLLFLGVCACALCFVVWNYASKAIGAVQTSIYIYLNPVITVAVSAVVLSEPVTKMKVLGTMLTIAGLVISEIKKN